MAKRALITGNQGQDGYYLTQLLQGLGYEIHGIDYPGSTDLTRFEDVERLFRQFQPNEIYHLAAFHHSSEDQVSNDLEIFKKSHETNVLSTAHLLEGMIRHAPAARMFFASSSLIYGNPQQSPQNEETPFNPVCLYGLSKYQSMKLCKFFHLKHGIFVSTGILYNHESPRRSSRFVTQKIIEAAVAIKHGKKDRLVLGQLNARVDWGFAGDTVQAMHQILQLDQPGTFVVATGVAHTILDFVQEAFQLLDLDWKKFVFENPALLTREKRSALIGNTQKLRKWTDWKPETSFSELVKMMIECEMRNYESKKTTCFRTHI